MAVKEVHGPGPRGARGPRPKVENPGKLLKRIMDEVFRNYLPHCILVLVCIVVSALANVQASLFLQTLMDDYIVPMTRQQDPRLCTAGRVHWCGWAASTLVGILAAWANARIMVNVTQGTLRNLRTKLFTHMESLPIRYFDTHPHGDIMSVYTNDVDTLRQMLSQSIPQLVSSVITIVSVFFSMLYAQLAADHRYHAHGGADAVLLQADCKKLLQVLHPAAAGSGQGERLHRGDDGRPEGGQGVQP